MNRMRHLEPFVANDFEESCRNKVTVQQIDAFG